jgi:peptidoglycan glycosyltransferase
MRPQITRLFGLIVFMFALLVVFTSRWSVIDASSLDTNHLNRIPLISELMIKRGQILAGDGTILAKSIPAPGHTWSRQYPTGSLFAPPIGYAIPAEGQSAGVELSDNTYLTGTQSGLSSIFGQISATHKGDDVYTTLDPKAQRAAVQALGGQAGAVVALNPRTGAILAMVSNPTYNSNKPFACRGQSCQENRATQAHYAPGSTFKIITAAAGLDSGLYTPASLINGNSPLTVSGVPLQNDNNQSWGPQTLTTAMTYSINTIFAQVAERVGRARMAEYMKRLGFYSRPPLDYPPSELAASGVRDSHGHLISPTNPSVDLGRVGIGEGAVSTTPLQMAMVAGAVANGGRMMVPHLTARVVNPEGVTVKQVTPRLYRQVIKPSTASELTQMMTKVVEEGTGTTVQIGGISIAGKTGTASIGSPGSNLTQPSFVCFAPVGNPKVAIAVTVDLSHGGYGATVAAPIAKAVLQALLTPGG